jgi:hypothetical protein
MSEQLQSLLSWAWRALPERKEVVEQVVVREVVETMPGTGKIFIRLAGLSGSAAVVLGAYGAHGKVDYDTSNALE